MYSSDLSSLPLIILLIFTKNDKENNSRMTEIKIAFCSLLFLLDLKPPTSFYSTLKQFIFWDRNERWFVADLYQLFWLVWEQFLSFVDTGIHNGMPL